MGLADLHIHTTYSFDGTCTVLAVLKYAHDLGLNAIAITDHDQIAGALEAEQRAPRYGIEVIPGVEVSTRDGHMLALFVRELIPAGLTLEETVRRVGELGGVAIAAHPMAVGFGALNASSIRRALQNPDLAKILLGIETFNAGLLYAGSNARAARLAEDLNVAATGSSDAHLLWMVGQGVTAFPGNSAADLRIALANRTTRAVKIKKTNGIRILGSWLPHIVLRRAGWVTGNLGPDAPLHIGRSASFSASLP